MLVTEPGPGVTEVKMIKSLPLCNWLCPHEEDSGKWVGRQTHRLFIEPEGHSKGCKSGSEVPVRLYFRTDERGKCSLDRGCLSRHWRRKSQSFRALRDIRDRGRQVYRSQGERELQGAGWRCFLDKGPVGPRSWWPCQRDGTRWEVQASMTMGSLPENHGRKGDFHSRRVMWINLDWRELILTFCGWGIWKVKTRAERPAGKLWHESRSTGWWPGQWWW